jgi:hypothetical protein
LFCTCCMVLDCVRVTGRDEAGAAAGTGPEVDVSAAEVIAEVGAGASGDTCRSAVGREQARLHRAPHPVMEAEVQTGAQSHTRSVQQRKIVVARRLPGTERPLAPAEQVEPVEG